jgi:hypothetical protein
LSHLARPEPICKQIRGALSIGNRIGKPRGPGPREDLSDEHTALIAKAGRSAKSTHLDAERGNWTP